MSVKMLSQKTSASRELWEPRRSADGEHSPASTLAAQVWDGFLALFTNKSKLYDSCSLFRAGLGSSGVTYWRPRTVLIAMSIPSALNPLAHSGLENWLIRSHHAYYFSAMGWNSKKGLGVGA